MRTIESVEHRAGFTLVELLVVMGLILILATIGAAYIPAAMDAQHAALGASNLQSWLQIARQRAQLDRAPRGLRLIPSPTIPNAMGSAQFIEQPDDFNEVNTTVISGSASPPQLIFSGVDLTNGSTDQTQWSAQPGDYVQLQGSGLVHQISPPPATFVVGPGPTTTVTLVSAPAQSITTPASTYRIIRQPRVLGEEPSLLPDAVAVDLLTNQLPSGTPPNPYGFNGAQALPPANPDGSIDILFSPGGEVLNYSNSQDRIILWVRDYNYSNPRLGEPTLLVIYTRSGRVAAYPVDITNTTNPYFLVP